MNITQIRFRPWLYAVSALALFISTTVWAGPQEQDVVKLLTNQSPEAVDNLITRVVGLPDISLIKHYDGMPDARFNSFSVLSGDPTEVDMTWYNFDDNDNNQIDVGQDIMVGWTTNRPSEVPYMYWQVGFGQQYNVGNMIVAPPPGPGPIPGDITFDNRLISAIPVEVSNVRIASFPTRWPLEQLNLDNTVLVGALTALPGAPSTFILNPGEDLSLGLPTGLDPDSYLVVAYDTNGGSATATDLVQFQIPEPATFALLAFGGIALIKRRRG